MCVCARARMRVCLRACMCAFVRACVRARVCYWCVRACVRACAVGIGDVRYTPTVPEGQLRLSRCRAQGFPARVPVRRPSIGAGRRHSPLLDAAPDGAWAGWATLGNCTLGANLTFAIVRPYRQGGVVR